MGKFTMGFAGNIAIVFVLGHVCACCRWAALMLDTTCPLFAVVLFVACPEWLGCVGATVAERPTVADKSKFQEYCWKNTG